MDYTEYASTSNPTILHCFDREIVIIEWIDKVEHVCKHREFPFNQATEAFAFALELYKRFKV